jgi:hypothetical protein
MCRQRKTQTETVCILFWVTTPHPAQSGFPRFLDPRGGGQKFCTNEYQQGLTHLSYSLYTSSLCTHSLTSTKHSCCRSDHQRMVLRAVRQQLHCHITTPGRQAVRFLQQQHRQVSRMAASTPAQQSSASSSRPKVAVGQMTAVGDQLTNFNTCSKLAAVSVCRSEQRACMSSCTAP